MISHQSISKLNILTLACFCSLVGVVVAQSSLNVFGSSYYSKDDIQVIQTERTDDGKIRIRFRPMAETLYYCSGVRSRSREMGTELIFVRSSIKAKPKVDLAATRIKDSFDQFIEVDSGGEPIYLRSGKKRIKIFPPDK